VGTKFITLVPGPSQLYAEIEEDIRLALREQILSISHRSERFGGVVRKAKDVLRTYFSIPDDYRVFFVSSAIESMEIALRNCCGSRSFHFINGSFARKFFISAQLVKKNPLHLTAEEGCGFSTGQLNVPDDCDLICLTHNETSTGIRLADGFIKNVRKNCPDKFIAVDIVSSAATERVPFEAADIWFFSVQKACGLPAGLGVIIVSKRALSKARALAAQGADVGSHHSLLSLDEFSQKQQTPATPNMLALYLLGKRFERLIKVGVKAVETQTREKAKAIYDWLDHHPILKPFVKNQADRSFTVVPVVLPEGWNSKRVQEALKPHGFVIGAGYGSYKESQIRIANFPQHSNEDIERVIEAIDRVLKS
jgi:phosphoserine aminotransferase